MHSGWGDMAANRMNACPPTRGHCSQAERRNRSALVRGHGPAARPADSTRRPLPGDLPACTHPCVEGDERARALRTPSCLHTMVRRHIRAGQVRAPLRCPSGLRGGALGSGCIRAWRPSNAGDSARTTCPKWGRSVLRVPIEIRGRLDPVSIAGLDQVIDDIEKPS